VLSGIKKTHKFFNDATNARRNYVQTSLDLSGSKLPQLSGTKSVNNQEEEEGDSVRNSPSKLSGSPFRKDPF
jgi:hypothetical protein